jgi:hypothetical protein
MTDSILLAREITSFNKIGYLVDDLDWTSGIVEGLDYVLPVVHGFEVVYSGAVPAGTFDFSSYFAAAEAAEVELLIPLMALDNGIPLIKEYYDRQSPLMIYGGLLQSAAVYESWEWTDEKCEFIITAGYPLSAGYPLTTHTMSVRQAYINRWNETPVMITASAYDSLRFILSNAIERAGTIGSEAVISALESTSIETSSARNFVFTSSHDTMIGEHALDPDKDYLLVLLFQWQNGEMLPVYPKKLMEEAGVIYMYPDWLGPWDNLE